MYFDNIFILQKAALTHFAYRGMIMKFDHPGHCFGVSGGVWVDQDARKLFFKESKHNDIKHKPFENKTFSEAMSFNPPTIRVFKCMYDTV